MTELYIQDTAPEAVPATLWRREIEVLTLLVDGRSSREIADLLFVSKKTIDFHLHNIYRKLGVHTRLQATICAERLGLVASE